MAYNDNHPSYTKQLPEWKMMESAFGGESTIKGEGQKNLPMTAGMINAIESKAEGLDAYKLYNAYKSRAQYPEWVRDAVRSMMGMVSRLNPVIDSSNKVISEMVYNATSDGFPIKQLFLRTVQQNIRKGRFGLLCDIDANGKPFIATYEAESIINWKFTTGEDGRNDLSLLVLTEKVAKTDDIFSHETKIEYLVYQLVDGRCVAYRINDSGDQIGEIKELSANNKPLTFIPFVFSGAADNAADVDLIPLATMAKSALKYYQLSADYYQELHLTAHPQPVITGQDLQQANMVTGPMMAWVLPEQGANAFYLEISGVGIEAKRVAMQEQKNAALESGARVMDTGDQESGEARMARQNDQYATLQSIVRNSAEAIEQCLRYIGEWLGMTPQQANEQLKFTVDLDFNKVIDTGLLQQLFSAAQMGMISPETVWEYIQTGVMPERGWDDEHGRILDAGGIGMNNAKP